MEHGHTVPSVETLEKLARALEIPLYQLFYEGKNPPKLAGLPRRVKAAEVGFGRSKKEARFLAGFRRLLAGIKKRDRQLLLNMAQRMAGR